MSLMDKALRMASEMSGATQWVLIALAGCCALYAAFVYASRAQDKLERELTAESDRLDQYNKRPR